MKIFNKKLLVSAISASLLLSLSATASEQNIGDLEIYNVPSSGAPTLTLMLDTSGSMLFYDVGNQEYVPAGVGVGTVCPIEGTDVYQYTRPGSNIVNGETLERKYCQTSNNGNKHYNRISTLKQALVQLLTSKKLSDGTRIALGYYSVGGNGDAGTMVTPANALTDENRAILIDEIKGLTTRGGTPTANALAEAGAYMMGTSTSIGEITNTTTILIDRGYSQRNAMRYCQYSSPNYYLGPFTVNENNEEYDLLQPCSSYRWGRFNTSGYVTRTVGTKTYYYEVFENIESYNPSGFSESAETTRNGSTYVQGAAASQCAGNGIYLLTDGFPSPSDDDIIKQVMNKSLEGSDLSVSTCDSMPPSLTPNTGWGCMGDYVKLLRDTRNPSGYEIKIATAGLGNVFDGLPKQAEDVDCEGNTNSNISISEDTRNLCRLGEEGYGFGEGGFTHIDTSSEGIKQLIGSITNFIASMTTAVSTTPSGTITIPIDPLSSTNIQPFAYLPMLEPKVGDSLQVWPGNLKKYHTKLGTLYGQNDEPLYIKPSSATNTNIGSFPYLLNPDAKDIWMKGGNYQIENNNRNDAIEAGGIYSNLPAPDASDTIVDNIRNVYVEDLKTVGGTDTRLVKIGVNTTGATPSLIGIDTLIDTDTYTPVAKAYLLNFLGYNVSTDSVRYVGKTIEEVHADLASQVTAPSDENKVLGGIVHSKPALVSYGGDFFPANKDTDGVAGIDANAGQISNLESDREDYLMFGSMDGALHLVKSETGVEQLAVIPRKMVKDQKEALQKGAQGAPVGQPVFGIDAPWISKAKYQIKLADSSAGDTVNKIVADKVSVYGGLRMGGVGFYGLDLSDKNAPKMKFSIERGTDNNFNRLGQTWSKPLVAKVRTAFGVNGAEDTVEDVVIFGGGYDMCYENAGFKLSTATDALDVTQNCTKKKSTYGNAVYMVKASDGSLLASWSGVADGASAKNTVHSDMKHSVVGGITGLDRNDNGTLDHLYFADLGGQVFRIDLSEGESGSDMTKRVVKVFDANEGIVTNNHIPYRFYERPIVSFYLNPAKRRFAAISLASGDRSSPLAHRPADDANRVYTIFDRDIAQENLFGSLTLSSENINTTDLINLSTTLKEIIEDTGSDYNEDIVEFREGLKSKMHNRYVESNGTTTTEDPDYEGWYYPLNRFDGYANVPNVKSVGEGIVLGSMYYMTVYSPDMQYGSVGQCSADIVGGSERQLYCMPYGLCNQRKTTTTDDGNGNTTTELGEYSSKYGTGGYTRGGKGIQEIAVAPLSKDNSTTKVLSGNEPLSDQLGANNRNDNDEGSTDTVDKLDLEVEEDGSPDPEAITEEGGDQSAALPVLSEKFAMVPKRWYEIQN